MWIVELLTIIHIGLIEKSKFFIQLDGFLQCRKKLCERIAKCCLYGNRLSSAFKTHDCSAEIERLMCVVSES